PACPSELKPESWHRLLTEAQGWLGRNLARHRRMKSGAIGVCFAALISTLTALSAQNGSVCRIDGHLTALPGLWEASGVAVGSGTPPRLWIVNDEGEPIIYSVELNGRIADRVRIAGATVEDWEDLAAGPCPNGRCLYIADIGDNLARRPRITVYRIAE